MWRVAELELQYRLIEENHCPVKILPSSPFFDGIALRSVSIPSRTIPEEPRMKGFQMAKNLYVGNLTWDATADDLLTLFQQHGTVTQAQVITDNETGRSRGFGFVEMSSDEEAQKAIEALNGTDYRGRPLTVNEARPREEHGGGRGGSGGGRRGHGGGRGGYGGGRGDNDRGNRY